MTISAKIIADSIGEHSPRLVTMQLRYPKFIHGELMTHRVFSRNASSSRAIPVERLIKDVIDDPVYPSHWGANQKGMQADAECDADIEAWISDTKTNVGHLWTREELWDNAREAAIVHAQAFTAAGYHKQIVNRLLEPFCHINVVVTSTEWSNFFALRCHPGAQPEMRILAESMRTAMETSQPEMRIAGGMEWHLPYITEDDYRFFGERGYLPEDGLVKISVARCARVSYLTQEGKTPSIEEDLKLYDRLLASVPLHASPAEHQATPDVCTDVGAWYNSELWGNFAGWQQYRKMLPGENQ